MSKTAQFFKISSLLVLGQLIASEGFSQVGPVNGNPSNGGGYYPCLNNTDGHCVSICGDACFCNIEGSTYGSPYNVCWVDMNSEKKVRCKGQNNISFEENGIRNPLCNEYK